MTEVNRQIRFYDKFSDKYIGEFVLDNIDLNDLLPLISIEQYKEDYLLYNCYLLDKSMLDRLSFLGNLTFEINMDRYEYYLEATAK